MFSNKPIAFFTYLLFINGKIAIRTDKGLGKFVFLDIRFGLKHSFMSDNFEEAQCIQKSVVSSQANYLS